MFYVGDVPKDVHLSNYCSHRNSDSEFSGDNIEAVKGHMTLLTNECWFQDFISAHHQKDDRKHKVVTQACNPAVWEIEPGSLGVRGQPRLPRTLKTSLDYMRPGLKQTNSKHERERLTRGMRIPWSRFYWLHISSIQLDNVLHMRELK